MAPVLRWVIPSLMLIVGCLPTVPSDTDQADLPDDEEGPGSLAWADDDITCEETSDCLVGETCADGVCQVERCTGEMDPTESPLGEVLVLYQENEIAVADTVTYQGNYWIDAYAPDGSKLSYEYSWNTGNRTIVDIAGGDVNGTRPEAYVAAVSGQKKFGVFSDQGVDWTDLDFVPTALAVADTEGDGIKEVVAASSSGDVAVCHVSSGDCEVWGFDNGVSVLDVSAGDIDGDLYEEVVLLLESGGSHYIYGLNLDAELTGQPGDYLGEADDEPHRITVGDINGDRQAEIMTLVDGGWWDWVDDQLFTYGAAISEDEGIVARVGTYEVDGYVSLADLEAKDTDMDGASEVFILGTEGTVLKLIASGSSYRPPVEIALSLSTDPDRIAMADHDGDSPRAVLTEGPVTCQGAPVPTALFLLPPYDKDHSDGQSYVYWGNGESSSESYSDTVSLGLNLDIGVGASFYDVFAASFNETVSWRSSQTTTNTSTRFVGNRFKFEANPDLYSQYYGAVVLSWGCFDAYVYEIEDSGNHYSGSHGEKIVMTVPTGGGVSLWSTSRYNALAEAVGGMPTMDIPYAVGEVDSYPTQAENLDGQRLYSKDLLFPNTNTYQVSDVGIVGWWLMAGEEETTESMLETELGLSASITVAGVKVGGGTSMGWGSGYSLSVGSEATFSGGLPPIPDQSDTPEDEYGAYAYRVKPVIYIQEYTDGNGEDAAFYVQTYSVEN